MATQQERILKAMKGITAALRADIVAKGVNASGNLSDSLREESTRNTGSVFANDYFDYVVFGRGPTKGSGDGSLYDRIKDWVNEKPAFNGMSIAERSRFAYFTTRKIHERGTLRGRSAQYPGLSFEQIINQKVAPLREELLKIRSDEFRLMVKSILDERK